MKTRPPQKKRLREPSQGDAAEILMNILQEALLKRCLILAIKDVEAEAVLRELTSSSSALLDNDVETAHEEPNILPKRSTLNSDAITFFKNQSLLRQQEEFREDEKVRELTKLVKSGNIKLIETMNPDLSTILRSCANDRCAFHYAAQYDQRKILSYFYRKAVNYFLRMGVEPVNTYGFTIMHCAAYADRWEVDIKKIIKINPINEFNTDTPSITNETPLSIAEEFNRTEALIAFKKYRNKKMVMK